MGRSPTWECTFVLRVERLGRRVLSRNGRGDDAWGWLVVWFSREMMLLACWVIVFDFSPDGLRKLVSFGNFTTDAFQEGQEI